jgi:hypothetical protein
MAEIKKPPESDAQKLALAQADLFRTYADAFGDLERRIFSALTTSHSGPWSEDGTPPSSSSHES